MKNKAEKIEKETSQKMSDLTNLKIQNRFKLENQETSIINQVVDFTQKWKNLFLQKFLN